MNLIEDIGDEEFYPVGAFISVEDAWQLVEDFIKHPDDKSGKVKWVSSNELDWPE